jgi:hypothetical protein
MCGLFVPVGPTLYQSLDHVWPGPELSDPNLLLTVTLSPTSAPLNPMNKAHLLDLDSG